MPLSLPSNKSKCQKDLICLKIAMVYLNGYGSSLGVVWWKLRKPQPVLSTAFTKASYVTERNVVPRVVKMKKERKKST